MPVEWRKPVSDYDGSYKYSAEDIALLEDFIDKLPSTSLPKRALPIDLSENKFRQKIAELFPELNKGGLVIVIDENRAGKIGQLEQDRWGTTAHDQDGLLTHNEYYAIYENPNPRGLNGRTYEGAKLLIDENGNATLLYLDVKSGMGLLGTPKILNGFTIQNIFSQVK